MLVNANETVKSCRTRSAKQFVEAIQEIERAMPAEVNDYRVVKILRLTNFKPLRATFLATCNKRQGKTYAVKFFYEKKHLKQAITNFNILKSKEVCVPEMIETFNYHGINACVFEFVRPAKFSRRKEFKLKIDAIIDLSQKNIVKDCSRSNFLITKEGQTVVIDFDELDTAPSFQAFYRNLSVFVTGVYGHELPRTRLLEVLAKIDDFEFERYRDLFIATLNLFGIQRNAKIPRRNLFHLSTRLFFSPGPVKKIILALYNMAKR